MERWKRFTERSRKAILLAEKDASGSGSLFVTVRHLVFALLVETRTLPECLARVVFFRTDPGSVISGLQSSILSIESREILKSAAYESRRGNLRIDVDHLLRAIVRSEMALGPRFLCWLIFLRLALTKKPAELYERLSRIEITKRGDRSLTSRQVKLLNKARIILICAMIQFGLCVFLRAVHGNIGFSVYFFAVGAIASLLAFPIFVARSPWDSTERRNEAILLYFVFAAATTIATALAGPAYHGDLDAVAVGAMTLLALVISLPLTAMVSFFDAVDSHRFHRASAKMPVALWMSELEQSTSRVTQQQILDWQSKGLMPEIEPDMVLVWKHVVDAGFWQAAALGWRTPARIPPDSLDEGYFGMGMAHYVIGQTYNYNHSMVCAGPFGPLSSYVPVGGSGIVLAILAKRSMMTALPNHHVSGGVFIAPKGIPIAAYRGTRITEDEFQYNLIVGDDALRWLGDPGSSQI